MSNHTEQPVASVASHSISQPVGVVGYVFSAFIPIVGVIYGIAKLAKGEVGPGLALFACAVLGALVWIALAG